MSASGRSVALGLFSRSVPGLASQPCDARPSGTSSTVRAGRVPRKVASAGRVTGHAGRSHGADPPEPAPTRPFDAPRPGVVTRPSVAQVAPGPPADPTDGLRTPATSGSVVIERHRRPRPEGAHVSTTVERSIVIDEPVRTVYDQWTQFEDFPLFMDGVEEVTQLTPETLMFRVRYRGVEREWKARITEQLPDTRIAWESIGDDPKHAGVVTFHHIEDTETKVMLQFDFWPEGLLEQYADKTGLVESYAEGMLEDFAGFIQKRGKATGAWRGEVKRTA